MEPHQLDGLSFPMTLVQILQKTGLWELPQVNIVVMGGSAKAEERIFCQTNYFEELTNFFTNLKIDFFFSGPELSTERHLKTFELNPRLKGTFYKGTTSEFLLN